MTRIALALALAIVLAPLGARADSLADIFEEANAAYYRGDYEGAARGYRRLIAAGVVDPDVTYNLATSEAKRGRFGVAIQLFERTLWLSPGDEDAARSLDAVRAELGRRRAAARGEAEVDAGPPLGEAIFGGASTDLLVVLALFFDLVLFGALAALLFARRESVRLGLGIAIVVAGLGLLASGSGVALKSGWLEEGAPAVVLADRTELREGPDPRASVRHYADEGRRAWVLDEDRGWSRVRVPSIGEGWVRSDAVGLVRVE
ncbi:MAG TPA: tetratricopeptide repeat protein [Sandaracinaceae bacterium]